MTAMLYIIRGLPGSGKTSLAKRLARTIVEADQFMVDGNGQYSFDPSRLAAAHESCRQKVRAALMRGGSVAVSNTFSQSWEYAPYIEMAEELAIQYQVISLKGHPTWSSVHGVPQRTIEAMAARWEP